MGQVGSGSGYHVETLEPHPSRHTVGSGWFFQVGWVGFIESVGP